MRIIGLDVGEKRIGVAKLATDTRIAVPVGFIEVNGNEWQEIAKIASLNNTNCFVLGLPRSNEGNETQQSAYVRNFAETLATKIPGAKIKFQDESLTSVAAEERLKARGKTYEKGDIDAEAATIILEDFVANLVGPSESTFLNTPDNADNSASKKRKKGWIIGGVILVLLAGLATGGYFWIKDLRAKERAEYYAELESQMVPDVFDFTILPGETIYQIKEQLLEAGYAQAEIDEAFAAEYDFDFLKGRPEGASLEGYLFGDTHEFYKSATVKEIVETFLGEMGRVIAENDLVTKYAGRGLTLFEGITLASIVQKEAPSPTFAGEQPGVAQVFLSRLAYGIPLGSDVTVSYALDMVDPNREIYPDNQAALKIDSCYNTRLYAGLPCGPISNPGLSALRAVAEPADTTYLYFLTGDDGVMYYGSTEAEHEQNRVHCPNLCNVSL